MRPLRPLRSRFKAGGSGRTAGPVGLEVARNRGQVRLGDLLEAADDRGHGAAEYVARRGEASRQRVGYVAVRPVHETLCGDVGGLAPAVRERAAGQPTLLDDAAEEVAGRVALGAMSRTLDQVAAERALLGRVDAGRMVD